MCVAWNVTAWGGAALTPVRSVLFDCLPPLVLAIVAARRVMTAAAPGTRALPTGARLAWALYAIATGINGGASVCWGTWQIWHPNAPTPHWVDLSTLLATPFLLASFLAFPTAETLRRGRGRAILDCLLALIPSALAIWYLGVHGVAHDQPFADRAIALGFPVGDLLTLFALATVLLRVPHPLVQGPLRWLAVSQVLATAADFAYACRNSSGTYLPGPWIDLAWLLCWAADGVALAFQHDVLTRPEAQPGTRPSSAGVDDSLLPAACVVLGYFEVFVVLHPRWPSDLAVGLAAATLSTVLLMVRQGAATRTNVRLLHAKQLHEARYRHLFNHSPSPMWVYATADGAMLDVNAAATRHYGYSREAFLALTIYDIRPAEDLDRLEVLVRDAARGPSGPHLVRHRLQDGRIRDVEVSSDAVDMDGRPGRLVVATDVTEREAAAAELARMAFHDGLTGLPNRVMFHDRVARALASDVDAESALAVIFVDLDDFKTVNDSLGHAAGDELLRGVAERLCGATRGSDTVARLGGDEFAVLLTHLGDPGAIDAVVARMQAALARPTTIQGRDVHSLGSLGIAVAEPGDTVEILLRNADVAMYAAKTSGSGAAVRYRPEMHQAALDRLELESAMRDALAAGEFAVHYQPILCLASGRPTGAEALVRWQHPTRGAISPAQFIPLAEATGLIVPLGTWVLREACRAAAAWPLIAGRAPTIAVNLSSRQLADPMLVATIQATLAEVGLAPNRLVLELTESALVEHMDLATNVLGALRAIGIRIAVDDFGTGYSSLAYLRGLPVDILKIDKTFVDALGSGGPHEALVRTIVALARDLGLRTVGEGVEHVEQRDALIALGCDAAQGFLFARPLQDAALALVWEQLRVSEPDVRWPTSPLAAASSRAEHRGASARAVRAAA